MLVLSRKSGQKLQIGDNITVTVLEVHGNVIRLGIEAPRDVRILRGELESWQQSPKKVASRRLVEMAVA
jgi:carbon storage regulator CsrA